MASIFTFRTRSADRDRETDSRRLQSLRASFDELCGQIRGEEEGLRRRYERVRDQAAFAVQNLDNGGSARLAAKADTLARTLGQCEARLATLKAQSDFLASLRDQLDARKKLWE